MGTIMGNTWSVYLSGEIHSDWRERILQGVQDAGMHVEFLMPVTDHAKSDDCGVLLYYHVELILKVLITEC